MNAVMKQTSDSAADHWPLQVRLICLSMLAVLTVLTVLAVTYLEEKRTRPRTYSRGRFLKLCLQPMPIFGPVLWLPWQPAPLDLSGSNQVTLLRYSRRPFTPAGSRSPQFYLFINFANLPIAAFLSPPPTSSNISIAGSQKLRIFEGTFHMYTITEAVLNWWSLRTHFFLLAEAA